MGRIADFLAGVFGQFRLGIETLHMTGAADHEQPDHALRLRSKVRHAGWRGPRAMFGRADNAVAMKHRRERHPGKTHPHIR